jgi:putative endonuclease
MSYFVYLLRCADNSLYCGITNNLEKRLKEHNSQTTKGAKYTRTRQPVTLVYFKEYETLKDVMKVERQIKKWSKARKETLIIENL